MQMLQVIIYILLSLLNKLRIYYCNNCINYCTDCINKGGHIKPPVLNCVRLELHHE